jgi:hypothetical protein
MTNQLPTYHGSPEDEGQGRLTQTFAEVPSPVPPVVELAPPKPSASNMVLDPDQATLAYRDQSEQAHRSFLNRLFGIFTGGGKSGDWETELDRTIDRYPEAASNFVLRGELLLKQGQAERAKADFLRAYVTDDQFGFVAQMTQDRALDGLKRAKALLGESD